MTDVSVADEDIFRARILTGSDDKPLRRIFKKLNALATTKGSPDADISPQQLESLRAAFLADLDLFCSVLAFKPAKMASSSQLDTNTYQTTLQQIQEEQGNVKQSIQLLTQKLADAQRERANKLEYDALAAKINAMPTKEASRETITRLEKEIETLGQEAETFKRVWQRRQESFDSIVANLEAIGRDVREEKSEQERKQAMDEDEDVAAPEETFASTQEQTSEQGGDHTSTSQLNPTASEFNPTFGFSSTNKDQDVEMSTHDAADDLEEGEDRGQEQEDGEMS